MTPEYPDISDYQTVTDWAALRAWTAQWDGVSRIAIKLTEGTSEVQSGRLAAGAVAAKFDLILWYHFARPDLNPNWAGAQAEVDHFRSVLGKYIRADRDYVMLDYEGAPGADSALWLPDWAWDWLHIVAGNENLPTTRCTLYSYQAFIAAHLQLQKLANFPLILARYTSVTPPVPSPFPAYLAWQYTSTGVVPGIAGNVDINRWYGPKVAPPVTLPPPTPAPDLIAIKTDLQAAQVSLADALSKLG